MSNWMKITGNSQNGYKTLSENEKLLGFQRLALRTCKNQDLFGKGLRVKGKYIAIFLFQGPYYLNILKYSTSNLQEFSKFQQG